MDIHEQQKKLTKALTPASKPKSSLENLGSLFTDDPFEHFDSLPLEQQGMHVMCLKAEWQLHSKRHQHNSGVMGGRPPEWTDEQLENLRQGVDRIKKTSEYRERKRKNDKGMMAVRILVEQLLANYKFQNPSKEVQKETISFVAKAFKVRLDRYIKTLNGT